MNKSVLKKLAYELNIELKGDTKAFVFAICSKYLKANKINNRELWLKNFLKYDGNISKEVFEIIDKHNESEFYNLECIGWLYQYFISEEKSRVFQNLNKNIKAEKEDIPYATQLFTPNWIVKYLVENSLGRFTKLRENFGYYIPVKNKDVIEDKDLEDIKFIDPCQGTGNILIYAFDSFYSSYIKNGYSKKEAIYNILTKNLYGIDIDETVCQISKIVLIFKAGIIDNSVFDENYLEDMNIICIKNSNELDKDKFGKIAEIFENADEYGSLIKPEKIDFKINYNVEKDEVIKEFLKQYEILNQKYDVVCTNPPYMGKKSINKNLSDFLKKNYPKTKSELYSAFIERCLEFTKTNGYLAMITIHSWMFISSFKNLRKELLESRNFNKYAS